MNSSVSRVRLSVHDDASAKESYSNKFKIFPSKRGEKIQKKMRERKHKTPTAFKTSSKTSFDRNFSSLTFSGFNISSFVRRGRREGSSCSSSSEEGGDSTCMTIFEIKSFKNFDVCVCAVWTVEFAVCCLLSCTKNLRKGKKRCVCLSLKSSPSPFSYSNRCFTIATNVAYCASVGSGQPFSRK